MNRLLNKLKSLLNSDNGVVLIGNLVASALGLGIFMLLARNLSKSDFGAWALFISSAGLLDLMRTGLVRQGMVRTIATSQNDNQSTLASAGFLAASISIMSSIGVWILNLSMDWSNSGLEIFMKFYPLLNLVTLPWNFDTWYMHALGKYRRMNALRLFVNVLFIALVGAGSILEFTLEEFVWAYLAANGLISIYSVNSLRTIHWIAVSKTQIKGLVDYGKHSLATLTGANLLKSADNLIIGALMGTEAVAIFAIPMKALDLMEIPLRGFVMTAFRRLSQLHNSGQTEAFKKLLFSNISKLTILCIPVALGMLIVPDWIIRILGGDTYEESYTLLRVLSIPLLLLPVDKFFGASLDSIGQPRINAIKVWIMVIANIAGDLLAIWLFDSLLLVAVVTIINIVAGVWFTLVCHPYLKSNLATLDSNQKSIIHSQSANTPTHS
ncbi:oligosaccharide flippase family protein [Marinoscillum pacificum]|uniref:oligosaccharide flippase family protein n=1 Tax=Marinoscillum pacificum TaxID=392723 RepID=UPI002158235D|nr:oligosaccharide flippase family protein [Marinoscillum pacificum]